MVHAPDTSLTPPCDNLGTLCHSQIIQASLVNLLITHPEMCPRFAEFQSAASAAALAERSVPGPSAEEFIQELAELMGAKKLPSQVIGNHADLLRHEVLESSRDLRNPQKLLVELAEFINICFPRTFDEWLELSIKAQESEETKQVISEITERVIQGLDSSIAADAVAVDFREIQRLHPELAFASLMMILSEFLGLNTIARPTLGEVITFARFHGLSFSEDDDQQRMQLTTMLLFHPIYQGKRESRVRRENPFAFVVRSELASPPDTIPLLPEIDVTGQLISLRVSDVESRPLANRDFDPARQAEPGKASVSVEQITRDSKEQSPESIELQSQRRNGGGLPTPARVKKVKDFIEAFKKSYNGSEPIQTTICEQLNMSPGTVRPILDQLRDNNEYFHLGSVRGKDRKPRK